MLSSTIGAFGATAPARVQVVPDVGLGRNAVEPVWLVCDPVPVPKSWIDVGPGGVAAGRHVGLPVGVAVAVAVGVVVAVAVAVGATVAVAVGVDVAVAVAVAVGATVAVAVGVDVAVAVAVAVGATVAVAVAVAVGVEVAVAVGVGAASSFKIVRVAGFGLPRVAPPVGFDKARFTVSSDSTFVSPFTVTVNVWGVASPSAQLNVPDAGT